MVRKLKQEKDGLSFELDQQTRTNATLTRDLEEAKVGTQLHNSQTCLGPEPEPQVHEYMI